MHPFTVLVLTQPVRFFLPLPDSLPQLFLRCLFLDFSFHTFHFPSAFFRPLSFNFRLLSFLFLPFCSSRFCLTAAFTMHPFHSRFQDFPVTLCLISHAFLHGSLTWLYWWFPFILPWFTPAAVPQVIPFWFSSLGPMHCFRFLSSTFALASHYLASVSSVPFLSSFISQWFLWCAIWLSPHHFPLSFQPDFSCLFFKFSYLASCLFPFALLWFTPTAVSQMIPLCFHFRDFPLSVHFLSSVSCSPQATRLSVFSFPFLSVLPHSGFTDARLSSHLDVFPFIFDLISHVALTGSRTQFSVRSLSFYPVSLPQLFDRWFLSNFSFRTLHDFRFLSSASARIWLLSFLTFFSLLLEFLCQRFFRCMFPHPSNLFPCLPSDSGTQLPAIPFSNHCFASQ